MNTQQQPSWIEKISTVGVVVLCAFGFGLQLYAFNKGFDITDEGYNIQLMRSRFVGTSNTYFFEVYKVLFGWLPYKVWTFRLVSTIGIVLSNLVLVTGAFRYFQVTFKPLYLATALLGIPLSVSLDPVTFSYNFATAIFTMLSAGLFLHAWVELPSRQRWLVFFSGLFASMVVMCKVTSGLALLVAMIGLILIVLSNRGFMMLWFGFGWILYQCIHAGLATPFWKQLQLILEASDIFKQMDANYSTTQLLNVVWLFTRAQLELGLLLGIGWVGFRYLPTRWNIVMLVANTAYVWYLLDISIYHSTAYIAILFVVYCVSLSAVGFRQWSSVAFNHVKEWLVMLLMWSLPLMVSLGTNNDYNYNYMFASTPLLVLGIVLLHRNQSHLYSFVPVLLVLLAIGIIRICYTKIMFEPYRILPLVHQNQPVSNLPVLQGIKLDESTLQRFTRLNNTFEQQGFKPGDPVICLGKMQGLLSVLKTSSPGGVMFSPVFKELYLHNLKSDTMQYNQPYFLLSDALITSQSSMFNQDGWGDRFNAIIATKLNHEVHWKFLDSIAFEHTPTGQLYLYQSYYSPFTTLPFQDPILMR